MQMHPSDPIENEQARNLEKWSSINAKTITNRQKKTIKIITEKPTHTCSGSYQPTNNNFYRSCTCTYSHSQRTEQRAEAEPNRAANDFSNHWFPLNSIPIFSTRIASLCNLTTKQLHQTKSKKKNWFSRFCCRELLFYLFAAESEEKHLSPHHFTLELEYQQLRFSLQQAMQCNAMVGKTTNHFLWWLVMVA